MVIFVLEERLDKRSFRPSVQLFWLIIKFARDDVTIMVAVVVKSLELETGGELHKKSAFR